MIRAFYLAEKEQLLHIVAEDFPVFVLGPGCFRVGFDNPQNRGWSDIERSVAELLCRLEDDEQVFLREFFFSKYSYERRSGPERTAAAKRLEGLVVDAKARLDQEHEFARANDPTAPGDPPVALTSFGPWRTLLATEILRAFRHASCCLGLVIGNGRSPVLHWQEAEVPTRVIAEWSRRPQNLELVPDEADSDDVRDNAENVHVSAENHFGSSREAIRAARGLALTMHQLTIPRRISSEQSAALADLSLSRVVDLEESVPASLVSVLEFPLEVLLPFRMAAMLDVLDSRCFNPPFEPLRGANVEWLGDLLWHVLASDAEVQPSQADLAFYVTLSEQDSPQLFNLRRSDPGDRNAENADLKRLTTRSQPENRSANADRDWVLKTIARCLHVQYQIVEAAESIQTNAALRIAQGEDYTDEENEFSPAMNRYVIALVGDYGDRFERALLGLLDSDAHFHVAVPLWVTTGSRKIDWLLATVKKNALNRPTIAWAWLAEVNEVAGPIVIKVNGCDRPPLGAQPIRGMVSEFAFEGPTSRNKEASMELALLYDEHDRLTAMQSFDELIGDLRNESGLVSGLGNLDKGLTWRGRSWVIMGQRFADWIPRLSLFTRKWAGNKDSKPATPTNYWAIDRAFDWPERSLLESLGITMIEGELGTITTTLTAAALASRRDSSPLGKRFNELFEAAEQR